MEGKKQDSIQSARGWRVNILPGVNLALHLQGLAKVEKDSTMSNQAYNVVVAQLTTATKGKNAKGTSKITFRGKLTVGGREIERTVIAQGAAADLIASAVRKGTEHKLRVLFERAPANEDGSKGGEFLTVVGLPREKTAKAA